MRKSIITAVNTNLDHALTLLETIELSHYQDNSMPPFYSSIGSHIRHTLDFFECIIRGLQENKIDLTARKREEEVANDPMVAKARILNLQQQLSAYQDVNTDYLLHVTDNLGNGKETIVYTLESIVAQANTHAVHHYAMIGYMLAALDVEIPLEGFGYNPSTPLPKREGI